MTNQLGEQYELKRKLINNSAEVLERMLKFAKDYKPSKEEVEEPLNTTTTSSEDLEDKVGESRIITSDDYWTIQNVNYQGRDKKFFEKEDERFSVKYYYDYTI